MSPVTGDKQQLGLEYKAQGRGRLVDPSGCIAVDFRQVPMEIAMVGRVGRTEIKAREEGGSQVGSARQELAEGSVVVLNAQSLEMFPVRSHICSCGSRGAEARAGVERLGFGGVELGKG